MLDRDAIIHVENLTKKFNGFTAGAHFGIATDLLVLSTITVFFLAIGSYLFSKIEI